MSETIHFTVGLLLGYAMGLVVGIKMVELACRNRGG